jgi:hypothetical protein
VESSSRQGRRPERTTYRITAQGARELQAWVRTGLAELGDPETFQVAISFMYALPKRDVIDLLDRRAAALDGLIDQAEIALGEANQHVSAIFLSEEHYAHHMRVAERAWVSAFVVRLRSGELKWPRRTSGLAERQAAG